MRHSMQYVELHQCHRLQHRYPVVRGGRRGGGSEFRPPQSHPPISRLTELTDIQAGHNYQIISSDRYSTDQGSTPKLQVFPMDAPLCTHASHARTCSAAMSHAMPRAGLNREHVCLAAG